MRSRHAVRLLVSLLLLCSCALAQSAAGRIRFKVAFQPADGKPASGRLLVFMSRNPPQGGRVQPGLGEDSAVWIASRDVYYAKPGATIDLDPDQLAVPKPFSQAPAGKYWIMPLLDVDGNAAYTTFSPGDQLADAVAFENLDPGKAGEIPLAITKRIPQPRAAAATGNVVVEDFVSPALSKFWGRKIHIKAVVVTPPEYKKSGARYPAVYVNHGFGANLQYLQQTARGHLSRMNGGDAPPMIYVLLLQEFPTGTHEFADSVNNGPWGHALTAEFIPYLERKYRMDARPSGRLLTGHSSGGWATLWLQVAYPDFFGGSWATSPDPVDFRHFTGPDLTASPPQNFYRKPDGTPWMLVRMGGKDVMSLEDYARQERVMGSYGGQMTSFEAVFSPRGVDGTPMQLFNRETGAIDPAVASYWERYDISRILRTRWKKLRPLLDGKIHIIVGSQDTFHLEESVRLLEQEAKKLRANMTFEYREGRDHFNLYEGGLAERIAKEMYEVARPKAKAASAAGQ